MSSRIPPSQRPILQQVAKRRSEYSERFKEQKRSLLKMKAMAKLAEDLGQDMSGIKRFAETGIEALDSLQEQLNAIPEIPEE